MIFSIKRLYSKSIALSEYLIIKLFRNISYM